MQIQRLACLHRCGDNQIIFVLRPEFFFDLFQVEAIIFDCLFPHPIQIHQVSALKKPPGIDEVTGQRVAKGNIEIAVVLSSEMRGQMAGTSGNADIQIEGIKTFVAERVQDTGCKNAPHSAALHNQS